MYAFFGARNALLGSFGIYPGHWSLWCKKYTTWNSFGDPVLSLFASDRGQP